MMLFKYFSSLDIDLKFNSSEELPDFIKKDVLFGKKMCELSAEQNKLKENMDSMLTVLLDCVNTDVELYFTVPDGIAVDIKGHGASFSEFIKAFGGYMFN